MRPKQQFLVNVYDNDENVLVHVKQLYTIGEAAARKLAKTCEKKKTPSQVVKITTMRGVPVDL